MQNDYDNAKGKIKKIFEAVVNKELSVTIARAQLKTLCLPSDAMKLILKTSMIKNTIKMNTFHMCNLSEFHYLINKRNLNEFDFPDFSTC